MGDQRSAQTSRRALAVRPVLVAWVLCIGVDLFFNAGLFASLFDQSQEPSLLGDAQLFRRIPVAYLCLAIGVAALAWIVDELDVEGVRSGVRLGAVAGGVFSVMGVVYLWTAIDMTAAFVTAGALVVVAEFAAAGWALSTFRAGRPGGHTRRFLLLALFLAVAGIVVQNLAA